MNSTVTEPAGPPWAPNTPAKPNRKLRFSLKTVLVVTAMVAAAFGFIVQQRRLADLQAALWRYEATQIPTSLGANEFRVIERVIVDTSHVKVVTYRIESTAKHFASIQGRGDSNGSSSMYDPNTNHHVSEATVLFDHLDTQHNVKMMASVGGAHGYSVANVPADFSLAASVKLKDVDGVHARDEAVDVFEWNGTPYSLRVK